MRHDPPLVYDCVRCGRSCRSFDVPLEKDELERIPREGWLELPSARPQLKREEGRCVFLSSADLCSLHHTPSKPRACRHFPLVVTDTPGGQFTGLSFCCTAVMRQQGRSVSEHSLEGFYPRAVQPEHWNDYLRLEPRLADSIDPADFWGLGSPLLSLYLGQLICILEAGTPDRLPATLSAWRAGRWCAG